MQSKTEQLDELRSMQNLGRSLPAAYFGLLENKLSYTESFYILHCPLSHWCTVRTNFNTLSQPKIKCSWSFYRGVSTGYWNFFWSNKFIFCHWKGDVRSKPVIPKPNPLPEKSVQVNLFFLPIFLDFLLHDGFLDYEIHDNLWARVWFKYLFHCYWILTLLFRAILQNLSLN